MGVKSMNIPGSMLFKITTVVLFVHYKETKSLCTRVHYDEFGSYLEVLVVDLDFSNF